ncbi:MAG: 4-hydroxy-tetrahydrodipicolinate reductase [Steroidobacteraceae bacterium]
MSIRVAIIGVGGRMGRALLCAIGETPDMRLAAAVARPGSAVIGQDAGTLVGHAPSGVSIVADPVAVLPQVDVAIDFSRVDASARNAAACAAAGVPLLIGTTGQDAAQLAAIDAAARQTAVLVAANTSLGLNVLSELVRRAAAALPAGFDIEIFETHHRHKVDAPSGTALALGDAAAAGRGHALQRPVPLTGSEPGPRQPGGIGFAVARGGDVVGEHEVRFLGAGEQLRLAHVATDRAIFARGALAAARWLAGRAPGRYRMSDFLF